MLEAKTISIDHFVPACSRLVASTPTTGRSRRIRSMSFLASKHVWPLCHQRSGAMRQLGNARRKWRTHNSASESIIGYQQNLCHTLLIIIKPGLDGSCTLFPCQPINILQHHPRGIESLFLSIPSLLHIYIEDNQLLTKCRNRTRQPLSLTTRLSSDANLLSRIGL